ncbi:MAG TPA: glycosyltransferase [Actinophytocola sp.]|uniref:glycosyltransferase n=1 Tax=Actinophytocola sp. TaxID=1872138 RepID=UPI002F95789D
MQKIALVAARADLRERDTVPHTPFLVALADALRATGQDVTVYVKNEDRRPTPVGHDIRVVALKGRFGATLADALRTDRPDVVHAHNAAVWRAAADAARELDVPFVYSLHDGGTDLAPVHAADHVVVSFAAQLRTLLKLGVPRHKVTVVPYGVDVDHFTPDGSPADPGPLRNRIVVLGDLTPSSGFATPVAALGALPDTELVIVGGPRSGAHARKLRDYARSLGVAGRLRLAGPVPRTDLPELLRSADLVVCSPWEPVFGVSALEAMACGVAVVANRIGGLVDTVVDAVTGTHVTPRRPRELAATLQRLLHHPTLLEQQGAAGRDRAWARYSWQRIAADTTHAYRRAGVVDPSLLARP